MIRNAVHTSHRNDRTENKRTHESYNDENPPPAALGRGP